MATWLYTRMMVEIRTGSMDEARKAFELLREAGVNDGELEAFLKELRGDNGVSDGA